MGWFKNTLSQLSLEFPVRNKNISELASLLETSGGEIIDRLSAAQTDSASNQEKMRHIIGIERWGQQRLRGFLGNKPPVDEHDAYLPKPGADLAELLSLFKEARAKTIYLGIRIETRLVKTVRQQPDEDAKANDAKADDVKDENVKDEDAKDDAKKSGKDAPQPETVCTIAHNEFGPLTPRGWLRYLELHARLESRSIK